MLRRGSLSSPDMLAPAMIPVAAGKKTAKTPQKAIPEKPSSTEPGKAPHQVIGSVIDPK